MDFNEPLKVCQNTIGSYTCYCKPQFVDDGNGNCVNRDECQEGVCPITGVTGQSIDQFIDAINISGCVDEICAPDDTDCAGYVCQCPEGYETSVIREEIALDTVDGQTVTAFQTTYICSDINECLLRNSCPANSGQ